MPKVTEQHSLARRRQIIDAAYRCFPRNGFHQTTMREIYDEAKLSPGAVYHYFSGKDEIIAASFDFDYQRSFDLFQAVLEGDDPLTALEVLLGFLFSGLKEASTLGAGRVNVQSWGEALVNPPILETIRRVFDSYRDVVAQAIRKAQSLKQIEGSLDSRAVSQLVLSMYCGLELQLALDPSLDVDKYAAAVTALLRSPRQQA